MGSKRSSVIAWALAAVAVVGLGAGVAWAETQSSGVPAGTDFTITAVVQPGATGGEVFGGDHMWDDDIEFSVGFDPSGTLDVCGNGGPVYDSSHTFTVTMHVYQTGSVWCANIIVHDDTAQAVLVNSSHVGGTTQPVVAEATAETVVSLTVD